MKIGGYHIGFAGTSHVREDDEEHRAWRTIAQHIGQKVVRRGHRLVTGGCSGGLTQLCLESAAHWLEGQKREEEPRLRIASIVSREKPPTVKIGRVLLCEDWSRDQRRACMASLEDSLITIGGVRGTTREGQCGFCLGTPVVPIYGPGGASYKLWQQIKDEFSHHPWYESILNSPQWREVNDNYRVDPQKTAEVAVDFAVRMATLKAKYHLRRDAQAGTSSGTYNVFVMMPFSREFDVVYETIELAVGKALNGRVTCSRADDRQTGNIDETIFRAIEEANLLIVDLTGNNGNVLLEYGYGLALGKKAILLNQRPEEAKTDLKNHKQIQYNPSDFVSGHSRLLKADLTEALRELLEPRLAGAWENPSHPVSRYPRCEAVEGGFHCLFESSWPERANLADQESTPDADTSTGIDM